MNKNESGRSMVEMLGVLAIIGVLSIGGVTGYSMAMNRYQAEQIFNAAVQLTATTTGGGTATSGKTINGVGLSLDAKGRVCLTWGAVSDDVKEIVETRIAPYERSGDCINFKKKKRLSQSD